MFFFLLDFRLFAPVFVLYFNSVLNSLSLSLLLFSVITISMAIFEVPTGVFSDLVGRRKTMIIGSVFVLAAFVFYATGFNFLTLFIGAVLEGIGWAFYSGTNTAILYDSLKDLGREGEFEELKGKVDYAMSQLGLMIASLVGGFVAAHSLRLVMYLSIVPQVGVLILSFFLVEPKFKGESEANVFRHIKLSSLDILKDKQLLYLLLIGVFMGAIGEAAHELSPQFNALVIPTKYLGVLAAVQFFVGFIGFWNAGKILKRVNGKVAVYVFLAVDFLTNMLVTFLLHPAMLFGKSINSFLAGVAWTALTGMQNKRIKSHNRATVLSVGSLLGNVGFAVFSVLFGVIADRFGIVVAMRVAAILTLPVVFVVGGLREKSKSKE